MNGCKDNERLKNSSKIWLKNRHLSNVAKENKDKELVTNADKFYPASHHLRPENP